MDHWFCVKPKGVYVCGAERPDNYIWGVEFAVQEVMLTKTLAFGLLISVYIRSSPATRVGGVSWLF